jgi:A/G-specific adenine glycosylase
LQETSASVTHTPDTVLANLAVSICSWQRIHGRHHLPWQNSHDPYRVWLSEIMLQQTQVTTVIPYFERFIERFPDIPSLAAAEQDEVMPYWAGLGYYARARNLHRCARVLMEQYDGHFPPRSIDIAELPGIGRSTAAAIAAFSYGERSPIMDGNVKRVFARYFGVHGQPGMRAVEQRLWALAERALELAPGDLDMAAYTQGLMDLGSQVCTRSKPACDSCPLSELCVARRLGQQNMLPTPRPKRAVPERSCAMLILVSEEHLLMERQADTGIWGGLWSLPRFDSAETLVAACRPKGIQITDKARMASFTHTFTHFRLLIEPWLIHSPQRIEAEGNQAWIPMESLRDMGMPAPVRSLVDSLPQLSCAPVGNG